MKNVYLLSEVKSKGNLDLLDESLTPLFCSNRCPGDLILKDILEGHAVQYRYPIHHLQALLRR